MSNETVTMMVRQPMLEVEMAADAAAEHRARARKLMIDYLPLRLEPELSEMLGIEIKEESNGLTFTFTKAAIDPLRVYQAIDIEWPSHDDFRSNTEQFKPYKSGGTFSPMLAAVYDVSSQVMRHIAYATAHMAVLEERQRQMSEALA